MPSNEKLDTSPANVARVLREAARFITHPVGADAPEFEMSDTLCALADALTASPSVSAQTEDVVRKAYDAGYIVGKREGAASPSVGEPKVERLDGPSINDGLAKVLLAHKPQETADGDTHCACGLKFKRIDARAWHRHAAAMVINYVAALSQQGGGK